MKRTLYKAILKSRSTLILPLSLSIAGVYAGYLIWYVLDHYFPGPVSDYRVFVSILAIWICTFTAIYKIPDQLFTNRRLKDVLCFPVPPGGLVFLVIGRLACLQFGITVSAFWAYFLYSGTDYGLTVIVILLCLASSCLIDLLILTAATAIGNLLPAGWVGYGFILFQYGAFLLLALAAGSLVSKTIFLPGFLDSLNGMFYPGRQLLAALLATALLLFFSIFCVNHRYVQGYLNTQNFRYRKTAMVITCTKINNPYFLLEWKRISRNKELIFFSNIKNILTVLILCKVLMRRYEWIGASGEYTTALFLLVSCCAVNTISSTAYSSDPNKAFFSFLPVSAHQLFLWKTLQGFLWGEITVLLFWIGIAALDNIPILDACLLLLYGTATNYGCVWLGVFLDLKMPRSPNSTNELLHGNISKVIVLFISTVLMVWEVYFAAQTAGPAFLLPFAACGSICVVVAEFGCWLFFRRSFHD